MGTGRGGRLLKEETGKKQHNIGTKSIQDSKKDMK
jgi:hypothetical protein